MAGGAGGLGLAGGTVLRRPLEHVLTPPLRKGQGMKLNKSPFYIQVSGFREEENGRIRIEGLEGQLDDWPMRLGFAGELYVLEDVDNDSGDGTEVASYGALDERNRQVYPCSRCGHFHFLGFAGDCSDDESRFASPEEASARFGVQIRRIS